MALCKLEQKSAGSVSIRHMLLAVEYDRVMGHDQISLPTVSLRHDSLCDIKGYQHFLDFLSTFAHQQTHVIPFLGAGFRSDFKKCGFNFTDSGHNATPLAGTAAR